MGVRRVVFWPPGVDEEDPAWESRVGAASAWTQQLPDDVLQAWQRRFPWLPWLAFDAAEYDAAFEGLDAKQAREAAEHRLEVWSPSVAQHSAARVYRLAQELAQACAVLRRSAMEIPSGRELAGAAATHFGAMLEFLDTLGGAGYELHTSSELATMLMEVHALFAAEAGGLDREDAWRLEAEPALRELGDVAVGLGARVFADGGRPHVDPDRVLWIDSQDPELLAALSVDGQTALAWGEAILAVQPQSRLEQLRATPLRVEIIARERGSFDRSCNESTPAQLERDWGPRCDAANHGQSIPLRPIREYLQQLAVRAWVMVHRTRAVVAADKPQIGTRLQQLEQRGKQRLLEEWGRVLPLEQAEAHLLACETRLLADLKLFAALGTLPMWTPYRAHYQRAQRVFPRWSPRHSGGGAT